MALSPDRIFYHKTLKQVCRNKNVWDFCCGSGINGIESISWGASHVTFTDVRKEIFEDFNTKGYYSDKNINDPRLQLNEHNHTWKFLDANNVLDDFKSVVPSNIDIIIYIGHFYHTKNHLDIVKAFSETNAEYVVFETKCIDNHSATTYWCLEETNNKFNTWEDNKEKSLIGLPSSRTCDMFFNDFGFSVVDKEITEWRHNPSDETPMFQYKALYKRNN